jgi:2-oxoglutarate dehydrogenase E2 component (dihydrolipoamide succinyltransferase)
MATNIVVPELGESIIEATVGQWLKKPGERVAAGEAVVELETEKVNLEVGAERGGVLARIERQSGEDVRIGDVLAVLEEDGDGATGDSRAAATPPDVEAPADADTRREGEPAPAPAAAEATPVARRMAEEAGIDLAQVKPTGQGNRVTKHDVQAYLEQQQAAPQPEPRQPPEPPAPPVAEARQPGPARTAPAPEAEGREERVRLSRRRRTIARRLVEAQQTAAMLTTFNEVDMGAVMEVRQRRREAFKERHGVGLGFMSFFVKASVGALKAFPMINAELQGDELVLKHYYDIGMAIGADEGLVVPVIRGADRLSFAEIERQIEAYVGKAREGNLALDDLRGGTFTITNGGVFGSLLSTPILNPPQVGILGLHKIEERPVARQGQVAIRPMMYVALSYDHRIVDGREAVQFLVRVKELIEDPETLLLES